MNTNRRLIGMYVNKSTTPHSKFPSGEPPYEPSKWNNTKTQKNSMIKATHNCYSYMLNDLFVIPRMHHKPQPGAYANIKRVLNSNQHLTCQNIQNGVTADNSHVKVYGLKKGEHLQCKPGHYKGFMMVSPGRDFHFARQDNHMITVYRNMHKDFVQSGKKLPHGQKALLNLYIKYAKEKIPDIIDLTQKLYPNLNHHDKKKLMRHIFKTAHIWSHKPGGSDATNKDASGRYILNPLKANWDYSSGGAGINYSKMCCFFEIPSNFTKPTYSSGYSHNSTKNSHTSVRENISKNINTDEQFESLLLQLIR